MVLIEIELLSESIFSESSLDSYVRRQEVKRVYRKQERNYILVDMLYVKDWTLTASLL